MSNRDRTKRKLSGIYPDGPEFELLVKKSQWYRQAISESVRLVELLRISHTKNIELREKLNRANLTLFQLKMAALGAAQDAIVQKAYEQEIPDVEARPEERPASPAA